MLKPAIREYPELPVFKTIRKYKLLFLYTHLIARYKRFPRPKDGEAVLLVLLAIIFYEAVEWKL
jgi:hypothetical protein